MKQHTLSYKNNIKEMGRELSVKITYGNITLDNEAINSVNPRYQGALLKSVMKELEIDSNVVIPKGTEINFKFGISLDNSPIEYLDFGNYIVKDIEKQEDTNSYLIKCYDKMLYSMDDYKSLGITYPCTIRAYINALCTKLNLNFKNKADTFVNYDKIIPNELYLDVEGKDIGYKYRDVFDELAQVTASTICLDINDNVEIRYINDTNDTIDEEYLKDVNVNFGEKFGPINSVVLSRNGEDNIYRKDDLSVQNNGLYEIKITDNQIMNFNNRDEYIDNIFNELKGIEYYLNDFSSTGITYYDLLDKYSVKIENKTYNCIMFNDDIEINQGLVENINTEKPEESQTDYSKADKTDRRINQTYRIVDKQNQTIKELITKTDGNTKQILQIDKSLDGIKTEVSNNTTEIKQITETSKSVTGTNNLSLDNALASNVLDYNVEGNKIQETTQGYQLFDLKDYSDEGLNYKIDKDYKINVTGTSLQTWSNVTRYNKTNFDIGDYVFSIKGNIPFKSDGVLSVVTDLYYEDGSQERLRLLSSNSNMAVHAKQKIKSYVLFLGVKPNVKFDFSFYAQLEKGNVAHQIEPYTGGQASPNPDYPQEVECVNKASVKVANGLKTTELNYQETITPIDLQGNELCRIREIKDLLHIDRKGRTTIEKRFAKYVFTGNENWFLDSIAGCQRISCIGSFSSKTFKYAKLMLNRFIGVSGYTEGIYKAMFYAKGKIYINFPLKTFNTINEAKQWLKDNPTEMIYELATPQTIELVDTNIPLFEGVNNLSLLANMETNTSCNYLLKTPLSKDYATNQRVDNTDKQVDNLDNNVKTNTYKIETNTKSLTNLSQEVNNIHASVTDIQTTTIQSIDGVAKNVETLTKKVDAKMTSEEVDLAIKKELENGTTKVKTETGYTFDSEGLKIAKEGEEMNSQFDNTGMYVKRDNEFILKANHDGVDATNLHAKTYLIIGKNSRFEDFERDGESRTACFWIGGNS